MATESDFQRIREQVEELTARRGASKKPLSSVRRGELLALANRPVASTQVTASPTMDEFNALQSDVKAILDALSLISNALGNAKFL